MRYVLKKRHEGGVGVYICGRGMFAVINYVRDGLRCLCAARGHWAKQ